MKFNRYTLGVAAFLVSVGLLSLAMLFSFDLKRASPLGTLILVAVLVFLCAGLMLRRRHFRWICGLLCALVALGVFLGFAVPSLTSISTTGSSGVSVIAIAAMVLMTFVPLSASYFLLLDPAFRQQYFRPRPQRSIFDIAFKVLWISLLLLVTIMIGFDVVRLIGLV